VSVVLNASCAYLGTPPLPGIRAGLLFACHSSSSEPSTFRRIGVEQPPPAALDVLYLACQPAVCSGSSDVGSRPHLASPERKSHLGLVLSGGFSSLGGICPQGILRVPSPPRKYRYHRWIVTRSLRRRPSGPGWPNIEPGLQSYRRFRRWPLQRDVALLRILSRDCTGSGARD